MTRPFVRGSKKPGLADEQPYTLRTENLHEPAASTAEGGPVSSPHLDDRAYSRLWREFQVALSLRAAVVKTLVDLQLALPPRSEASGHLWRGSRCDKTRYMASSKAVPCACGLATLEVTTTADGPLRVESVGGSKDLAKARRKQFATLPPLEDGRSSRPS